jgi:hypothetical protein
MARFRSATTIWIGALTAVAGAAIVALLNTRELQEFIEASGSFIPSGNVFLDYAAGVVWAFGLGLSIFLWPIPHMHKVMLMQAWTVKCFVALAVMLPYEGQYNILDCWMYFTRAHEASAILASPFVGGADLVVALGALHLKVGPDSYHAMKLTFSMIGLLAIYLFFLSAELLLRRASPRVFWVLFLYPSVLFWSSILGKDPVILLGIALHIWGLMNIAVKQRYGYFVAALAGLLMASAVRIWMGPILLIPALLMITFRIQHIGWRISISAVVIVVLGALGFATLNRLELDKAANVVEATQMLNRGWEKANSSLKLDTELNSISDLLLFEPQSIFIAYFRPLPGDVPHAFGMIAGCENLGLLIVTVFAVFRLRAHYFRNQVFVWAVTLMAIWGAAYGLVAYKDLGTAVRFKLQIIPVMLGVIGFLLTEPYHPWATRLKGRLR